MVLDDPLGKYLRATYTCPYITNIVSLLLLDQLLVGVSWIGAWSDDTDSVLSYVEYDRTPSQNEECGLNADGTYPGYEQVSLTKTDEDLRYEAAEKECNFLPLLFSCLLSISFR
jgi:hypothetical protein